MSISTTNLGLLKPLGSDSIKNHLLKEHTTNLDLIDTQITSLLAKFTSESFIAPTLTNSWVNYNNGYSTVGYYKDAFGVVCFRGLIKSGTINTSAFTLPSGYRPLTTISVPINSNNAFGVLEIRSDGTVVPVMGSNTWVSFDGISFRAGV